MTKTTTQRTMTTTITTRTLIGCDTIEIKLVFTFFLAISQGGFYIFLPQDYHSHLGLTKWTRMLNQKQFCYRGYWVSRRKSCRFWYNENYLNHLLLICNRNKIRKPTWTKFSWFNTNSIFEHLLSLTYKRMLSVQEKELWIFIKQHQLLLRSKRKKIIFLTG